MTVSKWKGRTALHVGARRGCVRLLERVLGICRSCERGAKNIGSPGSPDRKFENSREDPEEIGRGEGTGEINQDGSSTVDTDSELEFTDSVDSWALRDRQTRSLENLLLAVDGEYKLDAIAITVVNGNRNVVTLLLKAGANCAAVEDRYGIRFESVHQKENLEKWQKEDDHRKQLKMITEQVIERFGGDEDFRVLVLRRYDLHRDFNFLPREEYLFHILFDEFVEEEAVHLCVLQDPQLSRVKAKAIYQIVVTVIANMASSCSSDLWGFLWSLQDGQGRPPLHVAADDNSPHFLDGGIWKPLALVVHAHPLVDEKTLKRAMDARDGAGRTAWHRCTVQGNRTSLLSYLERERLLPGEFAESYNSWNVGNLLWDSGKEYVSRTNWNDVERRDIGWRKLFQDSMRERELSVFTRMLWTSRAGFCYRISLDVVSGFDGFEVARLIYPPYDEGRGKGSRDSSSYDHSLATLTPFHSVIIHNHSHLCAFFKWPLVITPSSVNYHYGKMGTLRL